MLYQSEMELEVRYYETDQMGIVHHSNYIRYFECGRGKMMDDLGLPVSKFEEFGFVMPVSSVSCKYKTPAKLGDKLRIVSRVEKEPMARVEVFTQIFNQNGDLVCEGEVVLGFLNKDTRRPTRAPKEFVDAFKKAIVSDCK